MINRLPDFQVKSKGSIAIMCKAMGDVKPPACKGRRFIRYKCDQNLKKRMRNVVYDYLEC